MTDQATKSNLEYLSEIDSLIVKAISSRTPAAAAVVEDKVEKSDNDSKFDQINGNGGETDLNANGGGDVIKNKDKKNKGLEKLKGEKDDEDEDEDEDKKDKKSVKKAKSLKKDEDEDDDDDEDDDEDDQDKGKDKKKMKKSEDSVEVSKEQYERLQKALKEDEAKAAKEAQENDPLFKSIEGLTGLVKNLCTEVETLKKLPARDPKSLAGYRAIEKSEGGAGASDEVKAQVEAAANEGLKKSQVLEIMHQLHEAGKGGVTDNHICEYEATGRILDGNVKKAVTAAFNKA